MGTRDLRTTMSRQAWVGPDPPLAYLPFLLRLISLPSLLALCAHSLSTTCCHYLSSVAGSVIILFISSLSSVLSTSVICQFSACFLPSYPCHHCCCAGMGQVSSIYNLPAMCCLHIFSPHAMVWCFGTPPFLLPLLNLPASLCFHSLLSPSSPFFSTIPLHHMS